MKSLILITLSIAGSASLAGAANIVWAADNNTAGTGTVDDTGVGPYADTGFVSLLQSAGHTVTRFNPPAGTLSAANVTFLNGFDLVILGRGLGSGAFDAAAESQAWNVQITKPLLSTNAYLSRGNRLGWFGIGGVGATVNNGPIDLGTSTTFGGGTTSHTVAGANWQSGMNFNDPLNSIADYIIGTTAMTGSATTSTMYEQATTAQGIDQGLSVLQPVLNTNGTPSATTSTAPVAGTTIISTMTAAHVAGSVAILTLPAGTALTGNGNTQNAGGFRMLFLAGNREPITPENQLGDAGWENLSAEGEAMFINAVEVAILNGVIPEPGTAALAGLASLALLRRRRA